MNLVNFFRLRNGVAGHPFSCMLILLDCQLEKMILSVIFALKQTTLIIGLGFLDVLFLFQNTIFIGHTLFGDALFI